MTDWSDKIHDDGTLGIPTGGECRAFSKSQKYRADNGDTEETVPKLDEPLNRIEPVAPSGGGVSSKGDIPTQETPEQIDDFNVTGYDEIRWVFNNMDNEGVEQHDAPSIGAWGLRETCRRDPVLKRNFYNNIWPKLVVTESSDAEKIAVTRDADRVLAQLNKVGEISTVAMGSTEGD